MVMGFVWLKLQHRRCFFCVPFTFCTSQQHRKSPAKATLVKKIELIKALKPLALEAWKKVTFEAVGKNKDFEHARVNMRMLARKEFLEMSDEEQEVYIFRLAL